MTKKITSLALILLSPLVIFASEADLKIPEAIHELGILHWGFVVTLLGLLFGLYQFVKVKRLPSHQSMLDIAQIIYKTCLTYLKQQGKLIAVLFFFIGFAVALYFGFLARGENGETFRIGGVILILTWTVIGILGSYSVAAYGIRMNTLANSRMAFASLKRNPLKLLDIPLMLE